MLMEGQVDVVISSFLCSMENNVYEATTRQPFALSTPFAFGGIKIGGTPFYVQNCTDANMKNYDECRDIKFCVGANNLARSELSRVLHRWQILTFPRSAMAFEAFQNGTCNVVAGEGSELMAYKCSSDRPDLFALGESTLTNVPYAAVTRVGDAQFTDFVSYVLMALNLGKGINITQATTDTFPQTGELFGDEYIDMFRNAIAVGGDGKQLFERYINYTPKQTIAQINQGDSRLLFAFPPGDVTQERNDLPLGETFTRILERGILHCGIIVMSASNEPRLGFVEKHVSGNDNNDSDSSFTGMDVDYCRAVAASLFQGDDAAIKLVPLMNQTDGFVQLSNDAVDVVAGTTWTYQNDVREPTSGIGFSFSAPYFYGYSKEEDNFCLATKQDDHTWSAFVFWVVMASIYAEANGITQETHYEMLEVFLHGPSFNRMFRDSILRVGNYAEMYARNVGPFFVREGRNNLNAYPNFGPQRYLVPGFLDTSEQERVQ